jgi:hypothetical protein
VKTFPIIAQASYEKLNTGRPGISRATVIKHFLQLIKTRINEPHLKIKQEGFILPKKPLKMNWRKN